MKMCIFFITYVYRNIYNTIFKITSLFLDLGLKGDPLCRNYRSASQTGSAERETDRQTDREREREGERGTDRETKRERCRERKTETDKERVSV